MNKKSMGNAGYFGKKVSELCRTVSLSNKVLNCKTKHLIKYEIKNKKYLMKLNGKFYKMNPDDEDYKVLHYKDYDLVGKTIYARGAQTCACGQNLICPTCLGKIADLNWDLKDGIGVFESQELSKDIEQKILSGKHLLTTKSEKIEFSDEFYQYFSIAVGEISPIFDNIDNINDLAIYVVPEEIEKVEEYDADSTYNTYISSGRFFVRNLKTKKDIEVKILKKKELYITSNVIKSIRNNNGVIKFKDLEEDAPIFEVIILNNELTKPLYELISLLDSEKKETIEDSTIDTFSQRFLDIIIESGIGASMVAAEIVMNRLIRESDNVMDRPDFSQEKMPDYNIYTIRKILRNNESITIGLGFENLKAQLLNPNVSQRTAPSYMDAYFKEELPTEILKKFEQEEPKKKQMDYYLNASH
jgi:hypothetical protein